MNPRSKISLYNAVRERDSLLVPHVIHRPAMRRLSRAVEAEFFDQAIRPSVLIGAFQKDRFFDESQRRWQGLAERATFSMVFTATVPAGVVRAGSIARLATGHGNALANEWAVIYLTETGGGAVVATEVTDPTDPADDRRFESVRVTSPETVREVAFAARDFALLLAPELGDELPDWFAAPLR